MQEYKDKFENVVALGIVNENGHLLSGYKMSDDKQPRDMFEIPKQDAFQLDDLLASVNTVQKEVSMQNQAGTKTKSKIQLPTLYKK